MNYNYFFGVILLCCQVSNDRAVIAHLNGGGSSERHETRNHLCVHTSGIDVCTAVCTTVCTALRPSGGIVPLWANPECIIFPSSTCAVTNQSPILFISDRFPLPVFRPRVESVEQLISICVIIGCRSPAAEEDRVSSVGSLPLDHRKLMPPGSPEADAPLTTVLNGFISGNLMVYE